MMTRNAPAGTEKNTFLTSQCITLFGSTLVQMALVWYATMQTSSGGGSTAFTVCSYLPFLTSFMLEAAYGRTDTDRKKLIIGADLLIAFVTFVVMVLAIPHISSEPALLGGLLVMSVIRSLGAGIQTPAVNAVIHSLSGRSAYAVQWHQCNNAVYC